MTRLCWVNGEAEDRGTFQGEGTVGAKAQKVRADAFGK